MQDSSKIIAYTFPFMIFFFVFVAFFASGSSLLSFSLRNITEPFTGQNAFLSLIIAFAAFLDFCFITLFFLPKNLTKENEILFFALSQMPVIFGLVLSIINNNGFVIIPFAMLSFVQYFITLTKTSASNF